MNVEATLNAIIDPQNGLITNLIRRIETLDKEKKTLVDVVAKLMEQATARDGRLDGLTDTMKALDNNINVISDRVNTLALENSESFEQLNSYMDSFSNDVYARLDKLENQPAPAKRSRKKKAEAVVEEAPATVEEASATVEEVLATVEEAPVPFAQPDGEIIEAEFAETQPEACPPRLPADKIRSIRNDIKVLGTRDFVAIVNADISAEDLDWALNLTDEQAAQYGA